MRHALGIANPPSRKLKAYIDFKAFGQALPHKGPPFGTLFHIYPQLPISSRTAPPNFRECANGRVATNESRRDFRAIFVNTFQMPIQSARFQPGHLFPMITPHRCIGPDQCGSRRSCLRWLSLGCLESRFLLTTGQDLHIFQQRSEPSDRPEQLGGHLK